MCTGMTIIREHGTRPDEDVVGQRHSGVHGHVVLDAHTIADPHAAVDEYVLPERAVATDDRPDADVRMMPDARAFTH